MDQIPYQRYAGAVMPGAVMLMLIALGLVEPVAYTKAGKPIYPIEGGDGTEPVTVLDRLRAKREQAETDAKKLIAEAEAESRDLTDEQHAKIKEHRAEIDRRDAQIADLEALEARSARAGTVASQSQPNQPLHALAGQQINVTRNESPYRPGGEHSFFGDLMGVRNGDWDAAERLKRSNAMERDRELRDWAQKAYKASAEDVKSGVIPELRDGTTSGTSMGSFIPPVWLVNQLAATARVGRVLAPFMADGGFPTTNSITIPRITTGSSVAGQAGDNAGVSETDIITAQLTRTTVTIAGQQDVSIQSLDLSPYPVDQIIFADLEGAYQQELDRQILRGSGTNELLGLNQVAGVNTVAYTDGTPTAAELMPKFGDAMQQIHSNRFAPAQLVAGHPRRWAWISTAVDTTGRALGVPVGFGGFNPQALFSGVAAQGVMGTLSNGLPFAGTGSCATNLGAGTEDQLVVFRPDDCILMESPRRTRILFEVLSNNLTVRLQLYSYVNFFAGRFPKSITTIGGTGLIAPTF